MVQDVDGAGAESPAPAPVAEEAAGVAGLAPSTPRPGGASERVADNTTLLHNDEESFALAPVDATVLKGTYDMRLRP